ncbi:hypothetical protein AHF37_05683 [Paragonimus kellicotti]|nr:hypothetical protein AHF37_05683 [Paragonimus kellicotti]
MIHADLSTDNSVWGIMKAVRWYLTILMIATFVEISVAQSHFGIGCSNMIRSLNQQCTSEGYSKYRCCKFSIFEKLIKSFLFFRNTLWM